MLVEASIKFSQMYRVKAPDEFESWEEWLVHRTRNSGWEYVSTSQNIVQFYTYAE